MSSATLERPRPPAETARKAADEEAAARPLLIVVNRASGADDGEAVLDELRAALAAAGRPQRLLVAERPDQLAALATQAVEQAVQEDAALVAVGGDGTINALAQLAVDAGVPFGALPRGTFNYFARANDLPTDPRQALAVWLDGHTRAVQVGEVNGLRFLVNASVGLYPRVLRAREQDNAVLGRSQLVAAWAGLRTVFGQRRCLRLVLNCDGRLEQLQTPTLFVGNNALQLEALGFAEAAQVAAGGQLAAISVNPVGPLHMVWLGLRGALGGLARADAIGSRLFRRLTVLPVGRHARQTVEVACDGEVLRLRAPLNFGIARQPLRLLVPRAPAGDADDGAAA